MRRLIILVSILILFLAVWSSLEKYTPQLLNSLQKPSSIQFPPEQVKVVTEESVVVETVKKVGPSVVTVAAEIQQQSVSPFFDFGPFSIFNLPEQDQTPAPSEPQNIGSGFIVLSDGLIVTNKHVVSDQNAKYQIITNSDKKYDVKKIYRDPSNDVAILKIDPSDNPGETLKPVVMGDSSRLQVGQFAIAIGTALGEFKNTVTTGVISGLGRGITAGSEFQGYVEKLDNVIQTDAAINPGNSGGPLLNSLGQVIGINTAIASGGQNIGFALPINTVKDSLNNFNQTGQFERPYLGVSYKTISREVALLNSVPQGAYIQTVTQGSPADKAGIKKRDIIIKIDNQKLEGDKVELSTIIGKKKVGDTVIITYWRDGKTTDTKVTLANVSS
ncbi:trypsin-like peptidase domain-containing protein [Patescibacteria group bacterium]|nr:trypsin-like peptidase domain-containing protein [Patescibacteria group bacterium]